MQFYWNEVTFFNFFVRLSFSVLKMSFCLSVSICLVKSKTMKTKENQFLSLKLWLSGFVFNPFAASFL